MGLIEVKDRTRKDYLDDPKNWINVGFLSYLSIFESDSAFSRLIETVHAKEAKVLRLAEENNVLWRKVDDIGSLTVERAKGPHHVYEHFLATSLDLQSDLRGGTNGITDMRGIHISPNPYLTMKKACNLLEKAIYDLESYNF